MRTFKLHSAGFSGTLPELIASAIMNVVVTHATGFLGRRLTRALQAAGHATRCMMCDEVRGRAAAWNGAAVVRGASSDAMVRALEGAGAAFLLCSPDHPECGARLIMGAARRADLRKVIVVTQQGGDPAASDAVQTLRNAGVPVLAVGIAPIFSIGAPLLEAVRYAVERLPVIPCPAWTKLPIRPIAVDDAVAALVGFVENGFPKPSVCLEGPESASFRSLMRGYAQRRGLRRAFVGCGGGSQSVCARALARITPVTRGDCAQLLEQIAGSGADGVACLHGRTGVTETLAGAVQSERPPAIRSTKPADLNHTAHRVFRRDGFIIGLWETMVAADPGDLFAVIEQIGGERGWYFADELWQARGLLDRAIGGVGMNRGRRDPRHLAAGDAFDFWRVEQVEPPRQLTLRAEMKIPGRAWLEFQCVPRDPHHTLLKTVVWYEPKGLLGEAYWIALYPFHVLIFDGMHREIAVRAAHIADEPGR